MTPDEFRRNGVYTSALRNVLADPIVKLAMEVLRDANPAIDREACDPEIASVRLLSQMAGYNEYANQFRLLAEPLPERVDLKATFPPED